MYRIILLLVGFAAFFTGTSAQPSKVVPPSEEEMVTIVAEPKFYVMGANSSEEMQLFKVPHPKRMWKVDGFIFEVIRPHEYAGRIIGMHHDGVLASGNPYTLWEVGRRYEFRFPKENIGKLSFGPCSLHGNRKLLPK